MLPVRELFLDLYQISWRLLAPLQKLAAEANSPSPFEISYKLYYRNRELDTVSLYFCNETVTIPMYHSKNDVVCIVLPFEVRHECCSKDFWVVCLNGDFLQRSSIKCPVLLDHYNTYRELKGKVYRKEAFQCGLFLGL